MHEVVIAILIIIGVVVIGALLFGGWLLVTVVKLIVGLFRGPRRRPAAAPPPPGRTRCAHARCRADNPERAQFCRRCGRGLAGSHEHARAMPGRRAALL